MTEWVELVAAWIEGAGVAVMVVGMVAATVHFLASVARTRSLDESYRAYRRHLGRSILLGLEFLIAGDIIATILVDPTLASVASLAAIVVIRTFLSFALEAEIEGRLPWRRAEGTP